ncbi:hypothetical protein [Pseudorhodobacter sp.]|uniref:hypothetical protein n=1 Tax=Pseudorhodobacter sp. TaxID=1934400 RepID=UPI00264772C5|nr:hypothetical protein [Pseudorhodobacter sp.]MDN5788896.1 hypothetical protein [Pseudorhodobacter sp.]
MIFLFGNTVKGVKLVTQDIPGGLRITEPAMKTISVGRIFGTALALCFVAIGIGVLFVSDAAMPGAGILLRATIATVFTLFGGFVLWAMWQNLSSVLEIDLDKSELRHCYINGKGRHRSSRTIAFADVKGVFTEGLEVYQDPWIFDERSRLIISFRGRNGRLDALTGSTDEITALRDLILTQALNRQAAPVVDGVGAFVDRAKWQWRQRAM